MQKFKVKDVTDALRNELEAKSRAEKEVEDKSETVWEAEIPISQLPAIVTDPAILLRAIGIELPAGSPTELTVKYPPKSATRPGVIVKIRYRWEYRPPFKDPVLVIDIEIVPIYA